MASSEAAARRWQQVEGLFRAAVELPVGERAELLDAACGSDSELRRELDELLAADAADGDLIAAVVEAGEDLLARQTHTLPPRFGKYDVEGRLGEGGFGVVYRGRDPLLDRPVAIKVCSRSDEALRRRFYREARIAAGLRHANITTVHELGVEDGMPFLVQELLEGEDLRQIIRQGRPLSLTTSLGYLVQIARGLEHAHGAGVLHRDVKPANVRVLPDGGVKLMDFGIAKVLGADTGLTGTGTTLGTVGYLAPEQLRSEAVDERADIFAFGVLAYELLSGERPFRGDDFSQVSYQLLYEEPTPLIRRAPSCPQPLAHWVHRCLAKERVERPGSMTAVRVALEELATRSDDPDWRRGSGDRAVEGWVPGAPPIGSRAASAGPPAEAPPRRRRPGRSALLTGLVLVVLAVAVPWLGTRRADVAPPPAALRAAPQLTASNSSPRQAIADQPSRVPAAQERSSAGGSTAAAVPPRDDGPVDEPISTGRPVPSPDRQRAAESAEKRSSRSEPKPSRPSSRPVPSQPVSSQPVPSEAVASGNGSPEAPLASAENRRERAAQTLSQGPGDGLPSTPPPASAPMTENGAQATQESVPDSGIESTLDIALAPPSEADASTADAAAAGPPTALETRPPQQPDDGAPSSVASEAGPVEPAEGVPMRRGDLITGPGPGITAPRLLSRPQPKYPPRALRRGIAEQVVVKVLVDEDGQVLQVIAPGADEHGFLAAARLAAQGALFEPARRDGVAGRMWINLSFDFTPQ